MALLESGNIKRTSVGVGAAIDVAREAFDTYDRQVSAIIVQSTMLIQDSARLYEENAKLKRAAERNADVMEALNLSLEESQTENAKLREERDMLQKRLDDMRKQREHWANEATKMYRLFFSHDEYCVPDKPSEMVAVAVRTLQAKLRAYITSIAAVVTDVGCLYCPYENDRTCPFSTECMRDGCKVHEDMCKLGICRE